MIMIQVCTVWKAMLVLSLKIAIYIKFMVVAIYELILPIH